MRYEIAMKERCRRGQQYLLNIFLIYLADDARIDPSQGHHKLVQGDRGGSAA